MPSIQYSDQALEQLARLVHDERLLGEFHKWTKRIADDPEEHLEPACFPFPQGRMMATKAIAEFSCRLWRFTVLVNVVLDGIAITSINCGPVDGEPESW